MHTNYSDIKNQWLTENGVRGWDGIQFSSVQSLSRVRLFATPWIAARQASLSITNSWSASWGICMQVRKQQLELDLEQQTGSK